MNCNLILKSKYTLPVSPALDIIENGAVAVLDNKIVAVGKADEIEKEYTAEKVVDAGNAIIMPGLINTHTHAAMAYFRGLADDLPLQAWLENHIWPAEKEHTSDEFVEESSELAILEMIKSGTTCFNDMYFFAHATARAAERSGIRSLLGEGVIGFPTNNCQNYRIALNKTEYMAREVKSELTRISVCPHSVYACDDDILLAAKELSDKYELPIHIHISETKKEADDCQREKGLSPVAHLEKINFLNSWVIAAHCAWLDDQDVDVIVDKGVKISHNIASNLKLGSGIMPIRKMLDKKLNISLGTDGAASNNRLDMFDVMRLTGLIHKGVNLDPTLAKAEEIVKMATINGARALGLDKEIGSLEAGKKADMIVIDLNKPHLAPIFNPYSHLVYCTSAADVRDVIINGQIIMENREVKTIDEEQVLFKAREYWK